MGPFVFFQTGCIPYTREEFYGRRSPERGHDAGWVPIGAS